MEMARELPSAGAFYTYVTRGLGPRAGLRHRRPDVRRLRAAAARRDRPDRLATCRARSHAEFDVNIPWWLIGLVPAGADGRSSPSRASARACGRRWCCSPPRSSSSCVLAFIIVGQAAATTASRLHPLPRPPRRTASAGSTTGFVFAALSFVGFEAAATLGEEVARAAPHRPAGHPAVGRSASASSTCSASGPRSIGLGSATRRTRSTAPSTPWNDLAATYAPWMKWPVIIASVSSMFAVMVNSSNGIVRDPQHDGPRGAAAAFLARDPPAPRTPSNAVFAHGRLRGRARARRRRGQRRPRRPGRPAPTSTATWASC